MELSHVCHLYCIEINRGGGRRREGGSRRPPGSPSPTRPSSIPHTSTAPAPPPAGPPKNSRFFPLTPQCSFFPLPSRRIVAQRPNTTQSARLRSLGPFCETRVAQGHTDRFSKLQRERWTQKKKNVARGSCLLHAAVGQQMEITSSINQKIEDGQLEMGQASNCRRERIHGSSRTLSDVNAKYWEVEPFAAIVMYHNETPRHVQQQKRSIICHSVYSFPFRREPQQGATPKLPT